LVVRRLAYRENASAFFDFDPVRGLVAAR
jgi:hypothetical protein